MPCFQGLAVSVHALNAPIDEFAIQKPRNARRISAYIPVPPARVPEGSTTGIPEQSTFAISITLLTPGLNIPYSTPKPTLANPHPNPAVVGTLDRNSMSARGLVDPYRPQTHNPNETIAAYIYFDGRPKEEVATLLRRGEETWVNSRWVSVPESEGGGLAEREFLFKEVGLERWLNGLDLEGKGVTDKAERIQKRQKKLEKKRKKQRSTSDSDEEELGNNGLPKPRRNAVLRYDGTPAEDSIDDSFLSEEDSSGDEEPPDEEAAGQIKIALFRVLASGDIKKGEYSPQFDAHDDDNMDGENGDGEEIDHTTSFAQPKTLDPKSISTQTVTGIDPPEEPYAIFTFFYRSEKQLRKMGILQTPDNEKTAPKNKRKSGPDFSKLSALTSVGTKGYTSYRDRDSAKTKRKSKNGTSADVDSDADDEDDSSRVPSAKEDEGEVTDKDGKLLSPEDARLQGQLAEGVTKMKLKRAHSAEPLSDAALARKSPHIKTADTPSVGTPASVNSTSANAGTPPDGGTSASGLEGMNSPFKRHRSSVTGAESFEGFGGLNGTMNGQASTKIAEAGGEGKMKEATANDNSTAAAAPGTGSASRVNAAPGMPGHQQQSQTTTQQEDDDWLADGWAHRFLDNGIAGGKGFEGFGLNNMYDHIRIEPPTIAIPADTTADTAMDDAGDTYSDEDNFNPFTDESLDAAYGEAMPGVKKLLQERIREMDAEKKRYNRKYAKYGNKGKAPGL